MALLVGYKYQLKEEDVREEARWITGAEKIAEAIENRKREEKENGL